jgi:ATP-binding cassette subfamily B protein
MPDLLSVPNADWRVYRGRSATVYALPDSYAVRRAPTILRDAERILDQLSRFLSPEINATTDPIDIYVTDPSPVATNDSAGETSGPQSDSSILLVVQPEAPEDPVAIPLTRRMVAQWFGTAAASARLCVDGIAGLVAARARIGPSVEEAEQWVQTEVEAGRPVSILAYPAMTETDAGQSTPGQDAHLPYSAVATAFVAFLVANFGTAPLRTYLSSYNPERHDAATIAAYQQPLGVLEETWLRGLKRRTDSRDALRSLLPRLLPLLKPYRLQQIEVICYLALAAVCSVTIPSIVKDLTNKLKDLGGNSSKATHAPSATFDSILHYVGILALLYVFNAALSLRRAQAVSLLNQRVLNSLQLKMFSHLQRMPHSFYSRAKVGDIMTRLTSDMDSVQSALSQLTNKSLYQIFLLAGGIVALFYNTRFNVLTWLILAIAPLFYLTYAGLRTQNKAASREQRKRVGQTNEAALEYLSNHSVIKAFGMEDSAITFYRSRIEAQMRSKLRLAVLNALTDLSEDVATGAAQLIIFGVGGYLVFHAAATHSKAGINIGDLIAAVLLVKYIIGPVASLSSVGQTIQQASGAMDRVNELLDEPITIADQPGAIDLPPLKQEIRLDNVNFGYEDRHAILRDLSFTIPAGTSVAIVGPSGSGKTTVTSLLMRFWDPTSGSILADGHELRDVTLASHRSQIGLVLQETVLFDTTIRENIAIGRPQATDAEIIAAAKAARMDSDIQAMPAGYDTVVGERGVRMSGGQRQRLAIARAILREPRILILDEATSALDAQTEAGILETLSALKQGRTVISVTHRLSWAREADLIFVLNRGRLAEQGTHNELVTAGGLYQKLYEEQIGQVAAQTLAQTTVDLMQLRTVPLFASLSTAALSLLAQQIRVEWHAAGTDIVRQGDQGDKLFLIGHGAVDVLMADGSGLRRINSLSDGDFFGEMAILEDTVRSATVRTTTPTQLYSLSRADFLALLAQEPEVRAAVDATVASRRTAQRSSIGMAAAPAAASLPG